MGVKRLFSTVLALLLLSSFASAQLRNQEVNMKQSLKSNNITDIVSLIGLNPDKFSMSHSYSLSFSSFGGQSYNSGLYLNTMQYRFSNPLTFYVQLGVQHHPLGNKMGNTTLQNEVFISGAGLQYNPSKNLKLNVEFSQMPNSMYYHNAAFRDPISRNRTWFDNIDHVEEDDEK